MALEDEVRVSLHEGFLPPLSLASLHLASPSLSTKPPAHKSPKLGAVDETSHTRKIFQLLPLAVLHIALFLVLQIPFFSACSNRLRTKSSSFPGLSPSSQKTLCKYFECAYLLRSSPTKLSPRVMTQRFAKNKTSVTDAFSRRRVASNTPQKAL